MTRTVMDMTYLPLLSSIYNIFCLSKLLNNDIIVLRHILFKIFINKIYIWLNGGFPWLKGRYYNGLLPENIKIMIMIHEANMLKIATKKFFCTSFSIFILAYSNVINAKKTSVRNSVCAVTFFLRKLDFTYVRSLVPISFQKMSFTSTRSK